MASLTYFLRNKNTDSETSINYYISLGRNNRLRGATPFSIKPKFWNESDQSVRKKVEVNLIRDDINNWLKAFDSFISQTLIEIKSINTKDEEIHKILKNEISTYLNKKDENALENNQSNEIITFYSFVEKFNKQSKNRINESTGKTLSLRTLQDYETTLNHIKDFETSENYNITFETINLDFYYAFKNYLEELGYALNTIGKYFKVLKIFMNEATEQGLNINLAYRTKRFIKPTEKSEQIYLNEDELDKILKLDLSENEELNQARDLFLIGAYTGLRVSDFNGLTKNNIHIHKETRVFRLFVKKTGKYLPIPIHPIVESILKKRDGNPPDKMNNQKINTLLETIGEKAKIKEQITTKQTKGGKIITTKKFKYQMIKNHTARRSFCTNAYLAKMSTLDIMAISGHSSEKTFLNYIKVSDDERAVKIAESDFFKPKSN